MRSREQFDEFTIGFGELERMKIGGFHPSKLGNFDRLKFAADDGAVEEMKFDGLRRVVMRRGIKLVVNVCFDTELFAQFPSQCGFQRFSRFDLASWELPEICKMNVRGTPREQDVFVVMNDGCRNDDHESCAFMT